MKNLTIVDLHESVIFKVNISEKMASTEFTARRDLTPETISARGYTISEVLRMKRSTLAELILSMSDDDQQTFRQFVNVTANGKYFSSSTKLETFAAAWVKAKAISKAKDKPPVDLKSIVSNLSSNDLTQLKMLINSSQSETKSIHQALPVAAQA